MAGKFIKGALVQFMPTFWKPVPNVIIFQFNPETMTHTWSQPESTGGKSEAGAMGCGSNPLAIGGLPGERFSLTIAMDANEMIADGSPVAEGIATGSGIYTRLAALEMLLYPTGSTGTSLFGTASAAISAGGVSLFGSSKTSPDSNIPRSQMPTVLFVWGAGRILPVRITGLTITEKLYDRFLNPTHAEAGLEMRVLTPEELTSSSDLLSGVAKGAYTYSLGLRQSLAVVNHANATESIIGMLPI